jgi:hypothetical protein
VTTYHCPGCSRPLEKSGEINCERGRCSVFACDHCVVVQEMFGEPFPMALTFAVDVVGRPFDPAAADGHLVLPADQTRADHA